MNQFQRIACIFYCRKNFVISHQADSNRNLDQSTYEETLEEPPFRFATTDSYSFATKKLQPVKSKFKIGAAGLDLEKSQIFRIKKI